MVGHFHYAEDGGTTLWPSRQRAEAVKQQAKMDLEYLQSLDNKLKDWNVTVPASIKSSLKSKMRDLDLMGKFRKIRSWSLVILTTIYHMSRSNVRVS